MTRRQKTVSKILEIKEIGKDTLEAEVKKAQEWLNAEQEKLDILESTYKTTDSDFRERQTGGTIPVHEVELYHTYLKHLNRQIEQQKCIVAIRAAELDKKHRAMVEAYKEHRLFEILHDKIARGQIKVVDRIEQKESDCTFLVRKAER
jgi:flagellar export protein FliJ